MGLEVTTDRCYCHRCGRAFGKRKGNFPVSYAASYKGIGHLPICRNCLDSLFTEYLAKCKSPKAAVRQMCRKLDLYWSDSVFDYVIKKSSDRSVMGQYLSKLTGIQYAGKCYDDTLEEEGILWKFSEMVGQTTKEIVTKDDDANSSDVPLENKNEAVETPPEIIEFWGAGYSDEMYKELELRRKYYVSRLPEDMDVGSEALVRQVCNLEVTIARDSAAGRSIEKSVNSLNTLIGSLNLKPAQKKNDDLDAEISSTPLGVWIYRFENKRPLPQDDHPNKIKKYILTWMGHLAKLVGAKNAYTKLYDEEIERLRVEKPEYADEDDEDLMIDAYSEYDEDSDGEV